MKLGDVFGNEKIEEVASNPLTTLILLVTAINHATNVYNTGSKYSLAMSILTGVLGFMTGRCAWRDMGFGKDRHAQDQNDNAPRNE